MAQADSVTLKDCGRVVGHEMGLWEFFSPTPGPHQVDRVLRSKLKFVKISLQKLKDGTWVVNHDPDTTIYPISDEPIRLHLDQITWNDVDAWKASGAYVPIYRLHEYIDRDHGKLCWMFSPKEAPNDALVDEIVSLGIQNRSVILTGGFSDVNLLLHYPEDYHLNFAGRVGSDERELIPYQPILNRLWAMEVDPTKQSAEMIQAVKSLGIPAYIDSMRFSWNYELFGTACKKVFRMGADYTQTNRPLQCKRKMGL